MRTSRPPTLTRVAVCAGLWGALCAGCRPALDPTNSAGLLPDIDRAPAEALPADGNWPGWRGVNSSGVSHDRGLPVRWSSSSGIVWRVEVPGIGKSSPVVWGDSVLLTTAVGDSPTPELAVLCFDRTSGRLRWRTGAGPAKDSKHSINGLAAATVATDGERILAFFGSSGLFCFDFQGRKLWHVSLGELVHDWGSMSSPVLFGDLVIQTCDHSINSSIVAVHKASGHEVWRTPRRSYGSWSTPVFVPARAGGLDRTEMVVNGTGTDESGGGWVIGYEPLTGKELWRVQGTTDTVWPTAVVQGSLVYSTSGRNGPTIAIEAGGTGDVTRSRVVWKLRHGAPYVPTGVAYRNRLYLVSDSGVITCHHAASGEELWRERLDDAFVASLVAADNKIYAASERGTVSVIAARDQFELLAANPMQERILATPAISRGQLFIRTESQLVCIAAHDGAIASSSPIGNRALEEDVDDANLSSPSDLAPTHEPSAAIKDDAPARAARVP